MKYIFWLNIS